MTIEPNLADFYGVNLSNMAPALRFEWYQALKSGKYQQTTGQLKKELINDTHAYCCLGVLCDISAIGEWQDIDWGNPDANLDYIPYMVNTNWSGIKSVYDEGEYSVHDLENSETLPNVLREYWNIDEGSQSILMKLNDGDPFSGQDPLCFDEIADIIGDTLIADGFDLKEMEANNGNAYDF